MSDRTYPYKRYMREYANDKIRFLRGLIKQYPHQKDEYLRMVNAVNKAVWLYERGYIITDEAMKLIAEA